MENEPKAGDEQQAAEQTTATQPEPTSPPPSAELAAAPPPAPAASEQAPTGQQAVAKTAEERRSALANALQTQVAQGARIESQSDFQAVIVRGHRVNHLLHFFIGLITIGVWWIVWLFIAIFGGEKRQIVNVDEFGNVFVQKV